MRVIIIGAGEVGYHIAKFLGGEAVDVTVVDTDKDKLRRISESMDVAVVQGEGGSPEVLKEARADGADMLLAVTNSDEANMIACLIGKAVFNIPRKVARIRNPEYLANRTLLGPDNLDIDPAISPEQEAGDAITRILEIPAVTDVVELEGGLLKVLGIKISAESPLAGTTLKHILSTTEHRFLIGVVQRGTQVLIPSGKTRLQAGDIVHVPVAREQLSRTLAAFGFSLEPAKKVMIAGGGRIGFYVAQALEKLPDRTVQVKIVERDDARCKFLTDNLQRAVVLHGDGSDRELLVEENIRDMDVFCAISNNEELNIMASLLARNLGVPKVITVVNRTDYINLANGLGIHTVLSPRLITAGTVLRYVRRGDVLALTAIAENNAEIIEARVHAGSALDGKTLAKAGLPPNSLVGAILRDDQVLVPSGQDTIQTGDKLLFFTISTDIHRLETLLE